MRDEIGGELAAIDGATRRLLDSAAMLTDEQVREPSLLPGWTRGHVLTHLARNADGLANALRSARSGAEIPMYASVDGRDADIEAGAGRTAAELLADVRESAEAFAREAGLMPAGAWSALARRTPGGETFPVAMVPLRRLGELEIHHADLGLGYGMRDWPAEFVDAYFPHVAGAWAGRAGVPHCLLSPEGTDRLLPVGPVGAAAPGPGVPVVHGPAARLLAWLIGRDDGSGLRVTPDGEPLPVLPAWR